MNNFHQGIKFMVYLLRPSPESTPSGDSADYLRCRTTGRESEDSFSAAEDARPTRTIFTGALFVVFPLHQRLQPPEA